MPTPRPSFPSTLAVGLVAAVTTWAALTAWQGFLTEPVSYLGRLAVVGVVIAVSGAVLRSVGTPRTLIAAVQVIAVAALVTHQITGSVLFFAAPGADVAQSLQVAVESARTYAAPISPRVPPVWPLLVIGGAVFLLLVDIVACTFRRVPAAGLALLAIYSVPSGLLEGGPGWGSFLLAATGFLALLHLDARDQLQRWGRTVGPENPSPWGHSNPALEAARAGAGRIALTATALALVVPTFLPATGLEVFDFGPGGGGQGDIRIRKPIADMKRDLERGQDVPLIEFESGDPSPSYLRVSVLNRFTGEEWSSGDRDVASDDTADGALPLPPGLDDSVPLRQYDYELEISDQFDSTWLPTQFPAAAVTADGDWRFDPETMDFLAADDDLDTRGVSYTMTALQPEYGTDGEFFRDAVAGDVPEELRELPNGLPDLVRDLARRVTEPAATDYERALLLQRWFRQDGGFVYDLRRAPDGTGNDTLEGFLSPQGRVGYCEQFASAMAVMARVVGIPSRVAVGFLEPTRRADGIWEYSSHDLHAWPELYFAGAGWVRFEPTPSGRVASVPSYSRVPVLGVGDDVTASASTRGPEPSGGTATVAPNARPTEPGTDQGAIGTESTDSRDTGRLLLVGGGVALALLLLTAGLLGPRAVRRAARRNRVSGDPDGLWAEVRATSIDLGVPWPDGRSPREIATVLVEHLATADDPGQERPRTGRAAAPEAAEALERLVLQVELTRYARPGVVATLDRPDLAADAVRVTEALTAGVTPRARQRAHWLPRSIWRS